MNAAKITKIKFIRNTMSGGKPARIGDVVDLPFADAKHLVHLGRAIYVTEEQTAHKVLLTMNIPETTADANDGENEDGENDADDGTEIGKMKVDDLKKLAAEEEIALPANAKKAEIVAIIEGAMAAKALEKAMKLGNAQVPETTAGANDGAGNQS